MHEIMSFYLENGLKVIMNRMPNVKTIVASMWINQGSQNETSENNGISHIAEHMVLNKNNNKNPDLIGVFDKLHNSGVNFNATTNKENTYYYFQGLNESLAACLEALKVIVVDNRAFNDDLFMNELKVIESEATSFYASFSQINSRMAQALYGDFGIGKTILGSIKNIQSTTLLSVESLLYNTYTPENSTLIIMGDINYEFSADKAVSIFNQWEDIDTKKEEENIDNEAGVYFDGKFAGTNAIFALGFRIPNTESKVHICTELLSLALSDPIMSKRIPVEIRQKRGLAYNVGGFVNQYKTMCTLGIACTCANSNIEEAIRIAVHEIAKVRDDGITEDELNRARMNLITRRNVEFSDPLKRTMCLGKYSSYNQSYSFEDEIRQIRKIDVEFINETSKRVLSKDNLGMALIGNVDIDKIIDIIS